MSLDISNFLTSTVTNDNFSDLINAKQMHVHTAKVEAERAPEQIKLLNEYAEKIEQVYDDQTTQIMRHNENNKNDIRNRLRIISHAMNAITSLHNQYIALAAIGGDYTHIMSRNDDMFRRLMHMLETVDERYKNEQSELKQLEDNYNMFKQLTEQVERLNEYKSEHIRNNERKQAVQAETQIYDVLDRINELYSSSKKLSEKYANESEWEVIFLLLKHYES